MHPRARKVKGVSLGARTVQAERPAGPEGSWSSPETVTPVVRQTVSRMTV